MKPEPGLAEAAEKTRDLIRGLQSRLHVEKPGAGEAAEEDLERQLHDYFERGGDARDASALGEIRSRVIEGVVEKILRGWEQPRRGAPTRLQEEVVERLIERVLERMQLTT
jgi:hypothetical protein